MSNCVKSIDIRIWQSINIYSQVVTGEFQVSIMVCKLSGKGLLVNVLLCTSPFIVTLFGPLTVPEKKVAKLPVPLAIIVIWLSEFKYLIFFS